VEAFYATASKNPAGFPSTPPRRLQENGFCFLTPTCNRRNEILAITATTSTNNQIDPKNPANTV
jgi:hypothetical protein